MLQIIWGILSIIAIIIFFDSWAVIFAAAFGDYPVPDDHPYALRCLLTFLFIILSTFLAPWIVGS